MHNNLHNAKISFRLLLARNQITGEWKDLRQAFNFTPVKWTNEPDNLAGPRCCKCDTCCTWHTCKRQNTFAHLVVASWFLTLHKRIRQQDYLLCFFRNRWSCQSYGCLPVKAKALGILCFQDLEETRLQFIWIDAYWIQVSSKWKFCHYSLLCHIHFHKTRISILRSCFGLRFGDTDVGYLKKTNS